MKYCSIAGLRGCGGLGGRAEVGVGIAFGVDGLIGLEWTRDSMDIAAAGMLLEPAPFDPAGWSLSTIHDAFLY